MKLELNEQEAELLYEAIQRATAIKLDAVAMTTDEYEYTTLQEEIKVLGEVLTRL